MLIFGLALQFKNRYRLAILSLAIFSCPVSFYW